MSYDNEMCELLCTVIITAKKGNIVYIMHDVLHEILILAGMRLGFGKNSRNFDVVIHSNLTIQF